MITSRDHDHASFVGTTGTAEPLEKTYEYTRHIILGHDSAAAIVIEGQTMASAQERFTRKNTTHLSL